jgi:hypothetical protein
MKQEVSEGDGHDKNTFYNYEDNYSDNEMKNDDYGDRF